MGVCIYMFAALLLYGLGQASSERWHLLYMVGLPHIDKIERRSTELTINTLIPNILGLDVNAAICVFIQGLYCSIWWGISCRIHFKNDIWCGGPEDEMCVQWYGVSHIYFWDKSQSKWTIWAELSGLDGFPNFLHSHIYVCIVFLVLCMLCVLWDFDYIYLTHSLRNTQ